MLQILNDFAAADLHIRNSFMVGATFSESDNFAPVPLVQIDMQPGVIVQRPEDR